MKIIKENNNVMMLLKEVNNMDDKIIKCNSVDASFEKHVPIVEKIDGNNIKVIVNHVMEEDHYIEWILVDYIGDRQIIKYFKPGDEAVVVVPIGENIKVYSYCNKHSLWLNECSNI